MNLSSPHGLSFFSNLDQSSLHDERLEMEASRPLKAQYHLCCTLLVSSSQRTAEIQGKRTSALNSSSGMCVQEWEKSVFVDNRMHTHI